MGLMATTACVAGRPLGATHRDEGYRPFGGALTAVQVPVEAPQTELVVSPGARSKVVTLARQLVGRQSIEVGGKRFGDDCTGLVRGVYASLGVDLMLAAQPDDNGVAAIYRFASRHGRVYEGGRPVAGDLVFFKETYDLNRDGQVNDGLTHIGLVDDVEPDGTVFVIHRVARGVVRYRMNLRNPSRARDATGKVINDGLRMPGRGSPAKLTGELFVSFGTLLPNDPVAQR